MIHLAAGWDALRYWLLVSFSYQSLAWADIIQDAPRQPLSYGKGSCGCAEILREVNRHETLV